MVTAVCVCVCVCPIRSSQQPRIHQLRQRTRPRSTSLQHPLRSAHVFWCMCSILLNGRKKWLAEGGSRGEREKEEEGGGIARRIGKT